MRDVVLLNLGLAHVLGPLGLGDANDVFHVGSTILGLGLGVSTKSNDLAIGLTANSLHIGVLLSRGPALAAACRLLPCHASKVSDLIQR